MRCLAALLLLTIPFTINAKEYRLSWEHDNDYVVDSYLIYHNENNIDNPAIAVSGTATDYVLDLGNGVHVFQISATKEIDAELYVSARADKVSKFVLELTLTISAE